MEESCPELDVEDAGIKQSIQLLVELRIFSEDINENIRFKRNILRKLNVKTKCW